MSFSLLRISFARRLVEHSPFSMHHIEARTTNISNAVQGMATHERAKSASPRVSGYSIPSRNESPSRSPPVPPRPKRGKGFSPVCIDIVQIDTFFGGRMEFKTKGITIGHLRTLVADKCGVLASQATMLDKDVVVTDDTAIGTELLSAGFSPVDASVISEPLL